VGEERVSKWRSGRLPVPELATLLKIAMRFGVSVDALLHGVCEGYAVAEGVLNGTVLNGTGVAKSAIPARKAGTHAPATSTAHILEAIAARQRIIDLTNQQIADLARGLLPTRPQDSGVGTAKSGTRAVRRNGRR
jgi:hypothetical protein